jgi:anti-sigma factor RsiW
MSSTAPQIRRLQAVAPRIAQAALERARLTVVPRTRRSRAPRVPFVAFVSVILLAGVIGLLLFNTSMQQASFKATALENQATDLAAQQEALEMDVAALSQAERVNRLAQDMGMVVPSSAGILDLSTGKVTGEPVPASGADAIPLHMPGPKLPAELRRPDDVKVPAGGDAAAGAKAKRTTDGAPTGDR